MTRTTRIISVSVPSDAAEQFEGFAASEGRNKSELFREMLGIYGAWRRTRHFESIQRHVAEGAQARGIRTQEDVERLIDELRVH